MFFESLAEDTLLHVIVYPALLGYPLCSSIFRCYAFTVMKSKNLFYLHDRCGHTKDAADFAIVLTVSTVIEVIHKRRSRRSLHKDLTFDTLCLLKES